MQSVWDLAAKRSITRQLAGSSRVNITNLLLINSCADVYIASPSMDLAFVEDTAQFIFGRRRPLGNAGLTTNTATLGTAHSFKYQQHIM
jgi:hypothetical protein